MSDKKICAGPIYFADQGIEVCETCGSCICCDFKDVDHTDAEYRCFVSEDESRCVLNAHDGRRCKIWQCYPCGGTRKDHSECGRAK